MRRTDRCGPSPMHWKMALAHGNGTSCDIYESGAAEKMATDRSGRRSARAARLRRGRCCAEAVGEAPRCSQRTSRHTQKPQGLASPRLLP